MRQSWSKIVVGFVVALAITAGASAQTPPAEQAAPPQMPTVTYPGDSVVILNYIQVAKAADFEEVMGKVKESLQKSDKPERKQQAEGWSIFKSPDPSGRDGVVVYVTLVNPVAKGTNYYVGAILQEAFPEEYVALYNKYAAAYAEAAPKMVPINLNQVISFK